MKSKKPVECIAPRTTGYQLSVGDMFSIEGFGRSARGHDVAAFRSLKTGKPMKVKTLTVFKVRKVE